MTGILLWRLLYSRRDVDFQRQSLEPSFHSNVINYVFAVRQTHVRPFSFETLDLSNFGDLVSKNQRVLDEFDDASDTAE